MVKTKFKKAVSLMLAAVMSLTAFTGIGATTAFAAVGEKADVYLVDYPRSGDTNNNGEWGHGNLNYMNGWKGLSTKYTGLRAMGSYSGNIAYCIEPGTGQRTGDTLTEKDENFFNNISPNGTISGDDIRLLIGRILQYGYRGGISTSFLDTQSRLDRYSAVNALLIFKQLPEASQLKNFDDWSKDNVKIQKGAKSISILEPVEYAKKDGTTGISYNVKKVFDVSQTNGKRPPAPTVNRDPKALITVMLDSSPVEVEATNELPYPNMAAFYNNEEQTLYVKRDVGDSVAVAQCVAQELGHAQLSINSDSYSRADMGFQAVCIGYMLCKKYGVDTQNFAINRIPEKLAGKEPKDIRYELSKTRNAMADIHSRVSDELYKKKQERSKDYER